MALFYSNRGQAYVRKGEYDRVIADYTKAIELDPKDAGAYNDRGSVYALLTGDLKRAIADFTEAIRLDPRNAGYYNDRAWAYFKAGNAAQGLPDAARSLELRPDHALTLDTRGHILEVLGRREEAIADFRKALSKDPSIEGSKNGLKRLGALP